MKHLSITVSGLVQGVFFRASAQEEAVARGLTGFTRNNPDGSVQIEAEGKQAQLEDYLNWCRHGNAPARVEQLEFLYTNELQNYPDFTIQR